MSSSKTTGYIGRPLIESLTRARARRDGRRAGAIRVAAPKSCRPVIGDALDASTYREHVTHEHTFVQLVGSLTRVQKGAGIRGD